MLSKSAEKGEKRFSADDDDGAARTHTTAATGHRSLRTLYCAVHRKSPSLLSSTEAQSEFNKSDAKFRHEIPVGLIRRTRGRTRGCQPARSVLKVGDGGGGF